MNGFVLIDKEIGWTSRDVDNKLGKLLGEKKVGHAGTLDPFATGLLIVGLGKGTKALTYFRDDFKEYVATLKLGIETSTGDNTGEVIKTAPIYNINKDIVENILSSFKGKGKQIPPMTSAIHYHGQKLYHLAREGIEVERTPRDIEIYNISLIDIKGDEITFKTKVSSGTYIRVLGEDIAKELGSVGHLISLRRTEIENIKVEDAKKIENINENDVISASKVLSFMHKITVSGEEVNRIKNGLPRNFKLSEDIDRVLVVDDNDSAIAVYKKEDNIYKCERGLW